MLLFTFLWMNNLYYSFELISSPFSFYSFFVCSFLTYQGPASKNPLAFKWYNADEEILGRKMKVLFLYSLYCLGFKVVSDRKYCNIVTTGLDEIQCCILAYIPWDWRRPIWCCHQVLAMGRWYQFSGYGKEEE